MRDRQWEQRTNKLLLQPLIISTALYFTGISLLHWTPLLQLQLATMFPLRICVAISQIFPFRKFFPANGKSLWDVLTSLLSLHLQKHCIHCILQLKIILWQVKWRTSLGPTTTTWKYLALLSSGVASIPGTGSAFSRWVSCQAEQQRNCAQIS